MSKLTFCLTLILPLTCKILKGFVRPIPTNPLSDNRILSAGTPVAGSVINTKWDPVGEVALLNAKNPDEIA